LRSGPANQQFGARQKQRPSKGTVRGYAVLYCMCALLLFCNIAMGLALYLAPEINALFKQDNSALLAAYEQRIVQLRLEVDRLHSRQYAQMGDLNLQMHELVQQQEVLAEQHEYVRALSQMAREMGIAMGQSGDSDHSTDLVTGRLTPLPEIKNAPDLARALITMQEETRQALVALSDAATLSTNEIVSGLQTVGLAPDLTAKTGIGGPFVPPRSNNELSIIDEANAVAQALSQFQSAQEALAAAPIRRPVPSHITVSSNFGNRTDPFLKRTAFHAGIDFRAPSGTPIRAAAAGEVVFAGNNGGYGKMVDIDHGNGIVTRYAHLNAIAVHVGQKVAARQQLGLSGSTGRSTGPHLHFEVRRNDNAIDPSRFLAAGRALTQFL